jgi:hypothetical protein
VLIAPRVIDSSERAQAATEELRHRLSGIARAGMTRLIGRSNGAGRLPRIGTVDSHGAHAPIEGFLNPADGLRERLSDVMVAGRTGDRPNPNDAWDQRLLS